MITMRMLRPQAGLAPTSRRQAAVALGLALAAALKRVGNFERVEARTWRGVPDVAHISGKEVDVALGRHVDVDAVEGIARALRRWDGVTLALGGELGRVKLGVEIDIYASEYVAAQAGIINEKVDVLAEPRGHVGGDVVESFYELFDVEHEKMKTFVEEFVAEMYNVKLSVDPLWRFVAWVYALRDFSFVPEGAIPLWYRPWIRQMVKYLYRLAPPGLRELRRVVEDVAPELLKYLTRWYEVKLHKDALQLMPMSTRAHRDAVADLKNVLTQAMKATTGVSVQKIEWKEYVKELKQRFKTTL